MINWLEVQKATREYRKKRNEAKKCGFAEVVDFFEWCKRRNKEQHVKKEK